jgi:hypothetical protein
MKCGCGAKLKVMVPRGWDWKEVEVRCGNTSPEGFPYLCDDCAERLADVDWKHEALMNGEEW